MNTNSASLGENKEILIATLGVEPQVVTITLDQLLSRGCNIKEAVVVYTFSPGIEESLKVIEGEYAKSLYPDVQLRKAPVVSERGSVVDFCDEEDLKALLRTLYREVRRARQTGGTVHLCISGGRKVMGIMGMVVAQLLFGPRDCLWHLVTEGWHPGAERKLHLSPSDRVWLVSVPVLRWAEAGTLLKAVAELNDPAEVVAWYERLSKENKMKRQDEFIRHWLTRAEREVVRLVCKGLDNATVAKVLCKSEQTVANQLGSVYEKLREWLGYPDNHVDRSVLIAEFAPYFAQMEEKE